MTDFGATIKKLFTNLTKTGRAEETNESAAVPLLMDFDNSGTENVLIIARVFKGGVKTYLLALIDKLGKEGYKVHVAGPPGSIAEELKKTRVITFPLDFSDSFAPLEDLAAARKLAKIIKTDGIKMVHAHGYKAGLIAGLAARRADTPLTLVTLHDYVINEGMGRMKHLYYDLVERYMPAMVDRITVVSQSLRKRVLEKGKVEGSRIDVISAGVRPASSSATASRRILNVKDHLALNSAAPLITTIGRLSVQKGIKHLLTAATHVLRDFPNAQFLIIGDGPQKHELEVTAEKLGIYKKVTFTGWRDDVREIVAAADVVVLPSMIEAMPYSLLEAMAAGKPTVATVAGGIPEVVVDRETGFLVPPKKPLALSQAIVYLLQNKDVAVQMGMAGRRRCEENFDLKSTVKSTIAVYDRMFKELAEYEAEQAAALEAKLAAKNS